MNKEKSPVFIVSTGRTGTKFLANLLGKYEETLAVHEPFARNGMKEGWKLVHNLYDEKYFINILKKNREKNFFENNNLYVESNPEISFYVNYILKAFPESKIIHIIRDGRDVVRSWFNRSIYTCPNFLVQISRKLPCYFQAIEILLNFLRYHTSYRIGDNDLFRLRAIDFPQDPFSYKWFNMDRFEKLSWLWMKKAKTIKKFIENYEYGYTIKFEKIFNTDNIHSGFTEIFNIINLEYNPNITEEMISKKVNASKEYSLTHWTNWNDEKKEQFNKIAGKHLKNLGYKWK